MGLSRVQARGQVTLPRDAREAARISPGDTVRVKAVGPGRIEVKVVPRLSLRDLLERYPIEGPVDVAADHRKWEDEAAKEVLGKDAN